MPVRPGYNPTIGTTGDIRVAGYALALDMDPQSGQFSLFKQSDPPRFGDKISAGDLKYTDFQPFESAESQSHFNGGFGLTRYSDLEEAQVAHTKILEADGVDVTLGTAILGPEIRTEILPGAVKTPVWIGEFSSTAGGVGRQVIAVAGQKVYTRATDGTWTVCPFTLAADAVQGAVGVFAQTLMIGYGPAATAQYTTNLTTLVDIKGDEGGTPNLYIVAVTGDKAAAYAACASTATATNVVRASTDGRIFATASATSCASNEEVIRGLAPGGGLATVYVSMDGRLGMIDTAAPASFHTLVPFDSRYNNNGIGLKWWMGTPGEAQLGPMMLVFTREREPWMYAPSDQFSGQAQALGPWVEPTCRPPNIRGLPTCYQGSSRWLYYAVTNAAGNTWILRRDGRSGATSPWLSLGANTCNAMCITMQNPVNPVFLCGRGAGIAAATLPLDGEWPLVDPNYPYCLTGTLDLPDSDLGFPDEDKICFGVRISADNLSASNREIEVLYKADGALTYTVLGTATVSPTTEIFFDTPLPTVKRIGLRLRFTSTSRTQTPELLAVVWRSSLNPKLYRIWEVACNVPMGQSSLPGHDLQDPHTVIAGLWAARQAGTPVEFIDPWSDAYLVRVISMAVSIQTAEADRPPDSLVLLKLLEAPGSATLVDSLYSAPLASGAFLPIILGTPPQSFNIYGGYLTATDTLNNAGAATIYPTWTLTGPFETVTLTNTSTGQVWALNYRAGASATVHINFDPSKHTVTDSDGTDLHLDVASGSVWWGFAPASDTAISIAVGGTTQMTTVTLTRSPF